MTTRKNALGRGLSALLGSEPVQVKPGSTGTTPPQPHRGALTAQAPAAPDDNAPRVQFVAITEIRPNPQQPRHKFNEVSLQELADSIREHGVLQPVLLTTNDKSDGYVLVAGERRFRAAERAGLREVPAIIQDVTDEEMLEIAIVENVQRDDLNPVEEARAYRALIDTFGWSQEQVAHRVGKQRSTVTNALRLLKLGEEALRELEEGRLTAGHARAILSIDDAFYRNKLRQEIVDKGISVREAERRAASYQKAGSPTNRPDKKAPKEPTENVDIVSLEEAMMAQLGCRVRIKSRDGRSGTVEVPFRNPDELERFLQAIGVVH
jgi:ParB family chromosome partitioning protein